MPKHDVKIRSIMTTKAPGLQWWAECKCSWHIEEEAPTMAAAVKAGVIHIEMTKKRTVKRYGSGS